MENNLSTKDNQKIRVLLVDDDSTFRFLLARRLERMGLAYEEAENGEKAIELLKESHFDLIITDIYMPKKDGFEVIHVARNLYPDVQFIIITASASIETAVKGLRNRVFDYLSKPIETLAIFDLTVTQAIKQRQLEVENQRLFEEIKRLSITDPLTGLYNRRKLESSIEKEISRAAELDRDLSLIIIDLDHLKTINDAFGHVAGDQALCSVADVIRKVARKRDLPSRFGGDEFVLLLPETKGDRAVELANQIFQGLKETEDQELDIQISIGVAEWNKDFKNHAEFMHAADRALYQSKQDADNHISLFQKDAPPVV